MGLTIIVLCVLCAAVAVVSPAMGGDGPYAPAAGRFALSRWAKDVSPDNPLPEYPRPQLARPQWQSLNGLWRYAVTAKSDAQPDRWQGRILVPFCIESPLSGVGKLISDFPGQSYASSRLWYRRTFKVPATWKGRRTRLNFGAVDWEATVWVNGTKVGTHRGGYDDFSLDITDALKPGGAQELVVAAWDPTDRDSWPRGKQVARPAGINYTPTTGIWQTVWIEPVAATHVDKLTIVPDVDAGRVRVTTTASGNSARATVRVTVRDGEKTVAEATGRSGQGIRLMIPDAKLWWPDKPFLYDLRVDLSVGGKVVDRVDSYFGMRKVSVGKGPAGKTRILLNDRFVFHHGVLDQGYWPGGVYTAPTDAALRFDIEAIKRMGFNMSRKHLKVEPQRWYYWADRLGLLVWQDMPCPSPPKTRAHHKQFRQEMARMIRGRSNHPSIVMWVLFNEGMGLAGYDLKALTTEAKKLDPTRPINHESGAGGIKHQGANRFDIGAGDIVDFHCYFTTRAPRPEAQRAAVIGEYGYAPFLDTARKYAPLVAKPGISGLVWTQITDVENERNGLMTYSRSRYKNPAKTVAAENRKLFGAAMNHEKAP